jgi:glycosyltransferase involved in cell wall biosynthesis
MRIAVLSLTRDRLAYTKQNFGLLHALAGCDYEHYVLDQGSTDGTVEWLENEYEDRCCAVFYQRNIGICKALNELLNLANPARYDVIVRFDNDCVVQREGTLKKVCEVALRNDVIVAPKVMGLRQPPAVQAEVLLDGDDILQVTGILGGVFMAIPAHLFTDGFRYDEGSPLWGGDEYICSWFQQEKGGLCGYLKGWEVLHESDQHDDDYPAYLDRKMTEMGR